MANKLKAYYYHDESNGFFIEDLDKYDEMRDGMHTVYKVGLCVRFTTAEFHHRVVKRTQRLSVRYVHKELVVMPKEWIVDNGEMFEVPF